MYYLRFFRKSYVQVPVYFIVFLTISILYNGPGLGDQVLLLLSVASFLFGFYIAFAISRAKERQQKVLEQLRLADGIFISCGVQMSAYGKDEQKRFTNVVDKYLVKSIDYKLVDIDKSSPEFFDILKYVTTLTPKNERQKETRSKIIDSLRDLSKERTILEIAAKERLSTFEWIVLFLLFGVIVFFMFNIKQSGLGPDILTAMLAAVLAMLMTLLYKYNTLSWREDVWIWQPLTRTFRMLGLLPYYPDDAVYKHRIRLPKDGPYRLAHYKHPYPQVEDREVEIVDPTKK